MKLRSALPYAKPRIIHNYLREERDRATLREGLRIAMLVARQAVFEENLKARALPVEPVLIPRSDTDQALDEFIRNTMCSFFHPSGTCATGAVLDSEVRVLGVDGLRVADTSVMPKLIGGNTNAPAIMIGEKAADLIRGHPDR